MREFFVQNETIILFAQGLVFFSLGFAVWLQRRRATRLTLTSSLIWLAAFAFVEALAVWGYVFVPIQETFLDPGVIDGLEVLRAVVQVAAFLFLVQFGLRLVTLPPVWRRSLTGLSILAAGIIFGVLALAAPKQGWTAAEWESAVVAVSRYALLLPGAALAAVGLWRQRAELGDAGMTAIKPYAGAAAAVLALYALVGGLIVAPGPITPGGIGDADGWFDLTGLPLEVVRGLAGLVLCVLAVKLLEIFDVEAKQQLEALDRARAIAEERARFRRDLHDGTIQSIYAAGLHLEAIAIRTEDPAVRAEVREVVGDLNAATDGIRDYIRGALAQPPATPEVLATGLGELTRRFADETGRPVRFAVEGVVLQRPAPGRGRPAPGADPARGALQHGPPRRQRAASGSTWSSAPTSWTWWSPTTAAARVASPTARRARRAATRACATCASGRAAWGDASRWPRTRRAARRVVLAVPLDSDEPDALLPDPEPEVTLP